MITLKIQIPDKDTLNQLITLIMKDESLMKLKCEIEMPTIEVVKNYKPFWNAKDDAVRAEFEEENN